MDPAAAPSLVLGVRRSAVLEVALYLAAALLLDTVMFSGTRFREVSPHPFWPLVLLMAVQYGTTEGLLAAAAATAVLLIGRLPEQAVSQDGYEYLLGIIGQPLLWFVAATALGELRNRHIRERDVLQQDLTSSQDREEEITAAYGRLTAVKNNLETRIAGQLRSAITVYQAARSLEKMDPSEVLLGVMEVVRLVMNPEKFSVYLLENGVLEVSMGEGWGPEESFSRTFRSDQRLFHEVIARQRVVCAASEEDERILEGEGILAGPLADRETGQVIGMLKIETIGFFDLHFSNVQTFGVLCDWIADAYVNARRFQSAESDAFVDPNTKLLSYAVYERQATYLRELAGRIGFSLSTVQVSLANVDPRAAQPAALYALAASAVRRVIGKADLAFDGTAAGCLCLIVMPGATKQDAIGLGERLLVELRAAGDVPFSYSVQTVAPVKALEAARATA